MAGDATDDVFDATLRNAAREETVRDAIREGCPMWNCGPRLYRDEEGLLTCKDCGESFDE